MDAQRILCTATGIVPSTRQTAGGSSSFGTPYPSRGTQCRLGCSKFPIYHTRSRASRRLVCDSSTSSSDDYTEGLLPRDFEQAVEEVVPPLGGSDFTPEALSRLVGCFLISIIAFKSHPYLLSFTHHLWTATGSASAADSRFFSFISLVFSILLGGTFTFQYKRLSNIINKLYKEVYMLELLWRNCKTVPNGLEIVMAKPIRRYIEKEIYLSEDCGSPFEKGSPLCEMYDIMEANRGLAGMNVVIASLEKLGAAQNERIAANVNLLPYVHWGLLWMILYFFAFAYLTFEPFTAIEDVTVPRSFVFAAMLGFGTSLILAVQDLSRPVEGIYSLRQDLKNRLRHLKGELRAVKGSPRAHALIASMDEEDVLL